MPRAPLQQRLISIVEPVCEAAGYELIDLRLVLEQGGWTLRVAVDLPIDEHTDPHEVPTDRVDLEDCENLSRELSAVLDVEDPIPQAFSLEVSSPGIDRPLRSAKHFQYFAGSEAKIQLETPLALATGERRNFKGILHGIDGGPDDPRVVIECDGTTFRLALDNIEHAKLIPDWDEVMKGKSGVGKPLAKPIKPGHRPSQKHRPEKQPQRQPIDRRSRSEGGGDPDGAAGGAGVFPREREIDRRASGPGDAAGGAAGDAENKEQG